MTLKNLPTKWNLSLIAKSDDDEILEKSLKEALDQYRKFIFKWKKDKSYMTNANKLAEALKEYNTLAEKHSHLGKTAYYFYLRLVTNSDDVELKKRNNSLDEISINLENDIQFFTLNLSKIKKKHQREFLENEQLAPYKNFLREIFNNAKYLLSEKEEAILNLYSKSAVQNWTSMVSEAFSLETAKIKEENGKLVNKTFSELLSLLSSKNDYIAKQAFNSLNRIFKKHLFICENEINSILYSKKVNDELRKIKRPDLVRHINDGIDSKVVDTLINTVSNRFNLSRNFYELKAKLMKQEKLEYYQRNTTYGDLDKKYSYEEAINLVYKVLNNLSPVFGEFVENFALNGHIDVYPKKGKRGGAFSISINKSAPIYVMLNFSNRLNDVLTIAHELGHAINSYLVFKNEIGINSDYSLATAEVASTFMEDFVLQEILKDADEELKLALYVEKLGSDISTIQRQVACYNFELDLHRNFRKKLFLSAEEVGELFNNNMKAYMGDFVKYSKNTNNWWTYWSHIRNHFYVYSYASGLLISKSLQNLVKEDKKNIEKVIKFLSYGSSKNPVEIFSDIGLDITKENFWNNGLNEQEQLFEKTLKLAKKLKKI